MSTALAEPQVDSNKKEHPCGFCRTNTHHLCPHAIRNGNHGLWFCACAEPNCGGKVVTCIDCKNAVAAEIDPDTRTCIDRDSCVSEIQRRLDQNPVYHQVVGIIERRKNMAKADTPTKTPAKPKTGTCLVTGQPTKGGLFLPGMDARYVSLRVEEVATNKTTEEKAVARMRKDGVSDTLVAKFEKAIDLRKNRDAAKAKATADKAAAKAEANSGKTTKAATKSAAPSAPAASGKRPTGAARKAAATKAAPAKPAPTGDDEF